MARTFRDHAREVIVRDLITPTRALPGGADVDLFWTSYVRVTFIVLALESAAAFAYFLASSSGPNRGPLEVMAAIVTAATAGAVPFSAGVARQARRSQLAFALAVVTGIVVTGWCSLDGGTSSPLLVLLVMPLINAAHRLPSRMVWFCGAATALEAIGLWASAPHVVARPSDLIIPAAFLAGILVLVRGWTISRIRLDREQAALFAAAVELARTDILTGCFNHAAFFEQLDIEISRAVRSGEPLSVVLVDVDHFKCFNDTHGHLRGDEALATIGRVLRGISRSADVVARIGGDEFAVILPATRSAGAKQIADRISALLDHPGGTDVTASVGYASMDGDHATATDLFRGADAGLYQAKATGRRHAASAIVPARSLPAAVTEGEPERSPRMV